MKLLILGMCLLPMSSGAAAPIQSWEGSLLDSTVTAKEPSRKETDMPPSVSTAGLPAPLGEDILKRVDKNMVIDQGISVAKMIIHGRSGTRTIRSKNWVKGRDSTLVVYLSPAREKDKKMLKIGDKIWNYTPEPNDRIITISGHLLRQSLMGSDLSYEDMTENNRYTEVYDAVVEGEEELEGRRCWVLKMTAKTRDVTYYSRRVWVDAERWLPLKGERYARSGRLLKTTRINEVFRVDGRWYPRKMTFKDVLSRGEGTEYIVESIDFDVEIPDHMFTKAALRK